MKSSEINNKPIKLRGHHLFCIITHVGKGYSTGFVENMSEIVTQIASGCRVTLVWGPDSICDGWKESPVCHCNKYKDILWRDILGFISISILLRKIILPGCKITINKKDLITLQKCFHKKGFRVGCSGCQWKSLCDEVSAKNFQSTVILKAMELSNDAIK